MIENQVLHHAQGLAHAHVAVPPEDRLHHVLELRVESARLGEVGVVDQRDQLHHGVTIGLESRKCLLLLGC
eukprot:5302067-Pyramimonas_sp.AAC.1